MLKTLRHDSLLKIWQVLAKSMSFFILFYIFFAKSDTILQYFAANWMVTDLQRGVLLRTWFVLAKSMRYANKEGTLR